jgi:hemin uptake protein HemP
VYEIRERKRERERERERERRMREGERERERRMREGEEEVLIMHNGANITLRKVATPPRFHHVPFPSHSSLGGMYTLLLTRPTQA